MITIEEAERHVISACLDPVVAKTVSLDWIENDVGNKLLRAILLLHRRNEKVSRASISLQLNATGDSVNEMTIKEIFNKYTQRGSEYEGMTKDYMAILMQRKSKRELLANIDKARSLIDDDQYNAAIALLKSLRFSGNSTTQNAMFWIVDSMANDNMFRSGFRDIDISGGLLKKNMMTISGDSGSQKTMFAQALMFRILKENPEFKAVFFEKEMPLEDLGRRIASWVLREDSNEMMRVISESRDIEQRNDILMQIRARMEQRFSENGEIKSMVNRLDLVSRDDFSEATDIWRILAQKQPDIWTLDFFTMLEPAGGIDDENMRKQAITLKNALLDTNSFGLVLSQLKQSNNVDMRANKVPMIGDMEWGKHLRQYSTWVFAIFYPHHYGIKVKDEQYFFLVSRKTRHGKAVIVPLLSDPSMALFTEPVGAKKGQMIEYINNYMTKGSNTDVFAKRSM